MKINWIILFIIIIPIAFAMSPQQLDQQPQYNCTSETNPLQIKILELNISLRDTSSNLTQCLNLSEYYKSLYESKEVNITHGELIQIVNNLNTINLNLNQTLNNIKQEFTKYKFDVTICAVSASILGFSVLELIIWGFKKWRKKKHESTEHHQSS